MDFPPREDRFYDTWERLLAAVGCLCSLLLALQYGQVAAALIRYPWDWSPDEGLYLDFARRLMQSPGSLYPLRVVPVPDFLGPGLPILLAPVVARFAMPLGPARVLAVLWTAGIVGAIYALIRRRAQPVPAITLALLALGPFHITFWYMLVRPDGLMIALWLWGAVLLLPSGLERGADSLSWPRTLGGAFLLGAAVFTKASAALHGAPIVLGWLLVDRRSFVRLGGAIVAIVAIVLVVFALTTEGGYIRQILLSTTFGTQPGLLQMSVRYFLATSLPLLVFALLGALWSLRHGVRPLRDPTLLLVAGGLTMVPALAKYGALPNYLLPLLCGIAAFAGRVWGGLPAAASADGDRTRLLPSVAAIAAALFFLRTQAPPVPPPGAEATARAFYRGVVSLVQDQGSPLLALRPEYAYFAAGQPVLAEGVILRFLLAAGSPGADQVLSGLKAGRYRTVVLLPAGLQEGEPLAEALHDTYRTLGACTLSYFYGPAEALIMVPKDRAARFDPPAGTRCRAASPSP